MVKKCCTVGYRNGKVAVMCKKCNQAQKKKRKIKTNKRQKSSKLTRKQIFE